MIKRRIYKFLSFCFLPYLFIFTIFKLLLKINKIVNADVIVYVLEDGFGHTVAAPDVQRRMFKGKNNVCLVFYKKTRHNPELSIIWKDIDVIFIPLTAKLAFFDYFFGFYKDFLQRDLMKLIKLLGRKNKKIIYHRKMYKYIPVVESNYADIEKYNDSLLKKYDQINEKKLYWKHDQYNDYNGVEWPLYYFKLIKHVKIKELTGLINIRKKIYKYTAKEKKNTDLRLCSLYLRQKNYKDENNIKKVFLTNTRCGSDFQCYLDAIGYLIKNKYIILLTGDLEFPLDIIEEYKPFLIDHRSLGISKNIFSVFAPVECDIAITEAGGGAWLPMISNKISLCINAFPFGYGMPNSVVYYKTCTNKNGGLVPYNDIFKKFNNDFKLDDYNLHSNTSEQIFSAVKDYVDNLEKYKHGEIKNNEKMFIPDKSWLKYSDAVISPAWLKLYD